MSRIDMVSFDAEGTLVTPDFSETIWHEAIPALYAQKNGLDFAQARKSVVEQYNRIGVNRLEWYDIEYWFSCLGLGSSEPVIRSCLCKISIYPEVADVLSSLAGKYKLIVASSTPLGLLHCLLQDVESYFARIFSSISHYGQVKNPEFYLSMCEEMGVDPTRVIHVGDSWQFDFLNARQAGLSAFHIDRSGQNNQESLSDLTQLKHLLVPSA